MGEYFEITFFAADHHNKHLTARKITEILEVKEGRNKARASVFPLLENREVYFQVFDETNFTEYQLSIMDLKFTINTLEKQLDQMMQIVSQCFDGATELLFATGIYELTDYYIQSNSTIADIVTYACPHYPFLFFRENGNNFGYIATKCNHNVSCVVQLGNQMQNVFAINE